MYFAAEINIDNKWEEEQRKKLKKRENNGHLGRKFS